VASDVGLGRRFAEARAATLCRAVSPEVLRAQVVDMRTRWRSERDRSDARVLDLKQGPGALVDIEFLLQAIVLENGQHHARLFASTASAELIDLAAELGLFDGAQASALHAAHERLLSRSLAATLDARPRVVPRDDVLDAATRDVLRVARAVGFDFDHAGAMGKA
jgi:glutamate-ammonia-ligase adenylyltransferase